MKVCWKTFFEPSHAIFWLKLLKSSTMPAAFSQLPLLMTSFEVQIIVMQISWLHIQCAGSYFAKSFKANGSEGKVFMKTFRIIG